MPRRNYGPRLRFLEKRGAYYIVWTDRGRSRERSTGTADRLRAEIALADFIRERTRHAGARDPVEVLVTDVLADYASEHAAATASPWRIAYAVEVLAAFWEGRTVASVSRETCRAYARARERSAGTVRRELGVLRAAINHAHREGRLTRVVAVHLPERPDPKDRWLTRPEAAALLRAARQEPKVRLHLPLFILMGLYTGQRKRRCCRCAGLRSTSRAGASISTRRGASRPTSAGRMCRSRRGFCRICAMPGAARRSSATSSTATAPASAISKRALRRPAPGPGSKASRPTRSGTRPQRG